MGKFLANIQSPDLYDRLDANKPEDTVIVNTQRSFQEMYDQLLLRQKQGEKISFGLGGGAAFGIVTYRLVKNLLDQGIKPDEFVGNSAGSIISTLLIQGYTDEKYIDFFFSKLDTIKDLTPSYFLARLIPFTLFLSEEHRSVLIEKNEIFQKYIEKELKNFNDAISENTLKKLLSNFLLNEDGSILSEEEGKKISFNDIRKKTGSTLSIQASVLTFEPIWMKKSKKKNLENTNDQGNRNHRHSLRPINFRGSYPVLDGLIASASPNYIKNTIVKGKRLKTTDGYWSGQNYPHKPSDFLSLPEGANGVKIIFMTEDNFSLTKGLSSDFKKGIDYVVRPDMRAGGAFDFSNQARLRFEKIANTLLSGETQK